MRIRRGDVGEPRGARILLYCVPVLLWGGAAQGEATNASWMNAGPYDAITALFAIIGVFIICAVWAARLKRQLRRQIDQQVTDSLGSTRESRDILLQGFQGVIYRVQAARNLLPGNPKAALSALEAALEDGDQLMAKGRPALPEFTAASFYERDFGQTLSELGKEFLRTADGQSVTLSVIIEGKSRLLKESIRDDVYRIAREALRNAFHHSKPSKIESEVSFGADGFSLRVRDDGIGLGTDSVSEAQRQGHWGLPGMKTQAEAVGGTLNVWSQLGAGTEVDLNIPAALAFEQSNPPHRRWSANNKQGDRQT